MLEIYQQSKRSVCWSTFLTLGKIWGFHSTDVEDSGIMGCYAK